jgi:hypothetical protein
MFETKTILETLAPLIAAAALLAGCADAKSLAPPSGPADAKGPAATPMNAAAPPAPDSVGSKGDAPSDGANVDSAPPAAQSLPAPMTGSASAGEGRAGAMKKPSEPRKEKSAEETKHQPGLGTEWGETRLSRITQSPFVRADPASPFATASLFYNDEAGARALAGGTKLQPTPGGTFSVGGGTVSVGLKDQSGGFFSGFVTGGRQVVVGTAGRSYVIVVKNNTANRFECVLSVDGLDVLDGKTAAFSKRGYILDGHGELEIDGFRQSMDTVAAFRFGSVQSSYASEKHGETRNVGVIGIALFNEQAGWDQGAVQKRRDANPFPGN